MSIINFGGLYGSDSEHGNFVYNQVALLVDADDDEGNIDYEKVENSSVNFQLVNELYCKELVKILNLYIKEEYNFEFNAKYISLFVTNEYNVPTDYIIADIPYESLLKLFRELSKNKYFWSYFNNTRKALGEDKDIYENDTLSDVLTYFLFTKTKMYEEFFSEKLREFIWRNKENLK